MESSSDIGAGTQDSGSLALRGVDRELRAALESEAARLGLSLNALVLRILRESFGPSKAADLHHDLDALAGVWSREEAVEFAEALRHFDEIEGLPTAPTTDQLLP